MADLEKNPDENENGQADAAAEPSPEDKKPKSMFAGLKLTASKDLEYVGLLVFTFTALALIVFITIFNIIFSIFDLENPDSSYRHLRSAELLLTLAATGLVVAIIGRSPSPAVLTIGIFLIGALIVPSKDIVRFALIASGSDKDYDSFFEAARSGTDVKGRSTDVANKIINGLEAEGLLVRLPEGGTDRNARVARHKILFDIIEGGVREEREITLLEQVRARGALETLRAAPNEMKGWVYKYGREQKFIEDLRFLRSEGLIRYAYDDLETIAATPLGYAVLEKANAASARSTGPAGVPVIETGGYPVPPVLAACAADIDNVADFSDRLISPDGHRVTIATDFTYLRFTADVPGDYQIDVVVDNFDLIGVIDPILTLAALSPDNDCEYRDQNDDGGDGLDSRLTYELDKQTYLIGIGNLSGVVGSVLVSVQKSDAAAPEASSSPSLLDLIRQ